ncbi:biotin--[acetyl-CoA-carboxylase] ligase [Croceibacterium sp. TMG7-5b_MA50]|uniref:biotin--[acetyl-CoA-carboxylase] ligase n=1 Tax=Croceibacterium sp. TMG7-5b_MA50 TaxID=3121290 RepID=UPI0032214538
MIEFVAATGSTNADLRQRCLAAVPPPEGTWLVADRQSGGRGRQGRTWLDALGNFMGSTIIARSADDPVVTTLPLVCGLAVVEALASHVQMAAALQLKWPNDVLLHGAKLGGILLEATGARVIAGFGINLASAPEMPDRVVGSLGHGPIIDRDTFGRNLAQALATELREWRAGGAPETIDRWLAAAHPVGTMLSVHDETAARLSGRFAGLEPDGALRLQMADGDMRVVRAGDVVLEGCEA